MKHRTRLQAIERKQALRKPPQEIWIGYAEGNIPWRGPNGELRDKPPEGPDVMHIVITYDRGDNGA